MKHLIPWTLAASLVLLAGCGSSHGRRPGPLPRLAHNVYFTLHDASPEAKAALVRECRTYLKDHPGVIFFAAGTLSAEHDRPVNVRDFDVALHVVFDSVAAQDVYQTAPDHLTFIERNKDNWKQVRVFDSRVD